MKIGITGGAGFIGGHVVDVALERGHDVVVFDSRGRWPADSMASDIGLDQGRVERRLGDVRDSTAMTELAAHVDGIIHLAACLGTQETIQNPRPAAETNLWGTLNFLEACNQYDIPGVYIGVGNYWMNNTYSLTKTFSERFVAMFNEFRHPKNDPSLLSRFNVVRLVNAYGPRQSIAAPFGESKVRKITPSFVCRSLLGEPVEVYGDGLQVSDMVHVRDGALALVKAMEAAHGDIVFDRPVEVGSTTPVDVLTMAKAVRRAARAVTGQHSEIRHLPMRPGEAVGRPIIADTSTLEFVDMNPADLISLQDGVDETVRWYAENWLPGYLASGRNGNS